MNIKKIVIPKKYQSIINKISVTAKENNLDVYAVGGFVRDLFINRNPKDLDIMVHSRKHIINNNFVGINFSKMILKKYNLKKLVIFEKFGTAKLLIDGEEVEFVIPRKEYYKSNYRKPHVKITSIRQDAFRRDFTVNALFLRLSDMKIFDFTLCGLKDIKNKIIRVTDIQSAKTIFKQDPLRILRAIRQSLQLNFNIEHNTYNAIKTSVKHIKIVSYERIRDELNKILVEKKPSKAFMVMYKINLLSEIFPEIFKNHLKYHNEKIIKYALQILDKIKNNIFLRISFLLHNVCNKYIMYKKKDNDIFSYCNYFIKNIKEIEYTLKKLKYSKKTTKKIISIVKNNIYTKFYFTDWTDSSVRKFANKCGNELNLVMEFSISMSLYFKNNKKLIEELNNRIKDLKSKNTLYLKQDLFSGYELMEIFNRAPGKWIKIQKTKIKKMQIAKPFLTKDEAIRALCNMDNY
ncbi:MAG: hypothetical protein LBQ07_02060 [Endomicrobium sp.]|jgi:tRNA nucleotidyltransferase/poly(A) polymerase|nr:hypothetical protein [Endomicrobium sp.]